MSSIRPVPGLDDVSRDSRCAAGLPKAALLSLLLRTAAVQSCLTAQLASIGKNKQPAPAKDDDRMLTTAEAATMLRPQTVVDLSPRCPSPVRRQADLAARAFALLGAGHSAIPGSPLMRLRHLTACQQFG